MSQYGNYRVAEYLHEFGLGMFARTSVTRVMRMLHFPSDMVSKQEVAKWRYVIDFLKKNYAHCIVDYSKEQDWDSLAVLDEQTPIWLFWWQGIETAPDLVRACYSSIVRNSGTHDVIVVTEDNLLDLVDIDPRIVAKVLSGQISFTHFSDIVRFALLSQRGGIWMDSTMYMNGPLPDCVLGRPYFTQPLGFGVGPWADFFQASGAGNPFTVSVANILSEYNIDHEQILTYLLMDCAMRAVHEHSNDYAELIENSPVVIDDMFALARVLDTPYSDEKWRSIKESPNFVSKLSYKLSHPTELDGGETFYGKLITQGRLP